MTFETLARNIWVRNTFGAILVGGLLGISGAFGTLEMPLSARMIYWCSSIVFCTLIANLVATILEFAIDSEAKPLIYHAVFLAILALVLPFVIVGFNHLALKTELSWKSYKYLFIPVFAISIFMTILHFFIERIPLQSHAIAPIESAAASRPKIFDRLEIRYRNANIFAVKSEDHYLRIFTSLGEAMILLRLYDAITELEGIEGVQTHRSWWVAIDAIDRLEKDYGKNRFILKSGIEVPISRGYAPTLKRLQLI